MLRGKPKRKSAETLKYRQSAAMSLSDGSEAPVSKNEILRCVTPMAFARSVCVNGGNFAHLKFFKFCPNDMKNIPSKTHRTVVIENYCNTQKSLLSSGKMTLTVKI